MEKDDQLMNTARMDKNVFLYVYSILCSLCNIYSW